MSAKDFLLLIVMVSAGCAPGMAARQPICNELKGARVERDSPQPLPIVGFLQIVSGKDSLTIEYGGPPLLPPPQFAPIVQGKSISDICYTNDQTNKQCTYVSPINPRTGNYEPLKQDPRYLVRTPSDALLAIPLGLMMDLLFASPTLVYNYSTKADYERELLHVEQADTNVRKAVKIVGPAIQASLHRRVAKLASQNGILVFRVNDDRYGEQGLGNIPDITQDVTPVSVLEVGVLKMNLGAQCDGMGKEYELEIMALSKLREAENGRLLARRQYNYRSDAEALTTWGASDGRALGEAIEKGFNLLAESIVEDIRNAGGSVADVSR